MKSETSSCPPGPSEATVNFRRHAPVGDYVLIEYPDGTCGSLAHARVRSYHDAGAQRLIESAKKALATFTCMCGEHGLRLDAYCREGLWILRAWLNTGHLHACSIFSEGGHGDGHGGHPDHLRVRMPKWLRRPVPEAIQKAYGQDGGGTAPMAIRTLLREIMWRAGTFAWSPASNRSDETIRSAIASAVDTLHVNGEPLTARLAVALEGRERAFEELVQWLSRHTRPNSVPLRYVVVELRSIREDAGGALLQFHALDAQLRLDALRFAEFKRSWKREYQQLTSKHAGAARVLAIVGFYVDDAGILWVDSLTPQMTSPEWMPAESRNEARGIHKAALEGLTISRSFVPDDELGTVCDLIIHYEGYNVRLEVVGLDDPKYRADLERKLRGYATNGVPYVVWDVRESAQPPELTPLVVLGIRRLHLF